MIRYFLVLAVLGGSLLLADMVLGFVAASEVPGTITAGGTAHRLVSMAMVVGLVGIHASVYAVFVKTSGWVREVVRIDELPDWYLAHAMRNTRRLVPFVTGSMAAIAVAALIGAAAETAGAGGAPWHLAAASMALAFNLGSFVVEYAAIAGHARLLAELKDAANRRHAVAP